MLNLSKFWYNLNLLNFVLIPFSYLYSFGYFVYKILNQEKN